MGRRAALMVLVLLVACGGDSANEGTLTLGQMCTELGQVICERAAECRVLGGATVGTCESQFVIGCCGGPPNTCLKQSTNVAALEDYIDTCSIAVEQFACASLGQGSLPVACIAPQ